MSSTIGDLKGGKFNIAEAGRTLSLDEVSRVRGQLEEVDLKASNLEVENRRLK